MLPQQAEDTGQPSAVTSAAEAELQFTCLPLSADLRSSYHTHLTDGEMEAENCSLTCSDALRNPRHNPSWAASCQGLWPFLEAVRVHDHRDERFGSVGAGGGEGVSSLSPGSCTSCLLLPGMGLLPPHAPGPCCSEPTPGHPQGREAPLGVRQRTSPGQAQSHREQRGGQPHLGLPHVSSRGRRVITARHGSWQGRGDSKLTRLAGRKSDSWMPLGLSKGWAPLRSLGLSLSITSALPRLPEHRPAGLQADGQEVEWGGERREERPLRPLWTAEGHSGQPRAGLQAPAALVTKLRSSRSQPWSPAGSQRPSQAGGRARPSLPHPPGLAREHSLSVRLG